MFANVTRTQVDMTRWEEARSAISDVKAMLRNREGFIRAVWLMPIDGQGLMISYWDSQDTASQAAPPVGFSPGPGVTVTSVETREVIDET